MDITDISVEPPGWCGNRRRAKEPLIIIAKSTMMFREDKGFPSRVGSIDFLHPKRIQKTLINL
jgi:hypothetical protein